MRDRHERLEKEHTYLTSGERVAEAMEANGIPGGGTAGT